MSDPFHAYPLEDRLRVRLRSVRRRLERLEAEAAERCEEFIAIHRALLGCSWGKDSIAVLGILARHGLIEQLQAVMWNGSGMDTPDTLAMRNYVLGHYGIRNYRETQPDPETLERTLRQVDIAARHPIRDFVYEVLEQPRWRLMDELDVDGVILGIRQQESLAREVHIRRRGVEYWNRREMADILLPIARWTTEDVYGYLCWREVPVHPVYAKMAGLGFPRAQIRHCTPVNLEGATRGQLVAYKRLYPDIVRRYAAIVPEITTLT